MTTSWVDTYVAGRRASRRGRVTDTLTLIVANGGRREILERIRTRVRTT
jgi:hypothetical protein